MRFLLFLVMASFIATANNALFNRVTGVDDHLSQIKDNYEGMTRTGVFIGLTEGLSLSVRGDRDTGEYNDFSFKTRFSEEKNPDGCKERYCDGSYPSRTFNYRFTGQSRQGISIEITDWAAVSKPKDEADRIHARVRAEMEADTNYQRRYQQELAEFIASGATQSDIDEFKKNKYDSYLGSIACIDNCGSDNRLVSALYLFPRKQRPTISYNEVTNEVIVRLTTGEIAIHDKDSMALKNEGSALQSGPISRMISRHRRPFADVNYVGSGVALRCDNRDRAGEKVTPGTWNVNELGNRCTLSYQGENCIVAKTKLFEMKDLQWLLKYGSDYDFNNEILKPECGWDISHLIENGIEGNPPVVSEVKEVIEDVVLAEVEQTPPTVAEQKIVLNEREIATEKVVDQPEGEIVQDDNKDVTKKVEGVVLVPGDNDIIINNGEDGKPPVIEAVPDYIAEETPPQVVEIPTENIIIINDGKDGLPPVVEAIPDFIREEKPVEVIVEVVQENPPAEDIISNPPQEVDEVTETPIADANEIVEKCIDFLAQYFSSQKNREQVIGYLKNQGKISLHRIAWTVLNEHKDGEKIQETISKALKERNEELHQKFISNNGLTRNQKLLAIMGELHKASQEIEGDASFKIQKEDLKIVDLLVESEKIYGRAYSEGIMDYLSIIRNSLKSRLDNKQANIDRAEKIISALKEQNQEFEEETITFLKEKKCYSILQKGKCEKIRKPAGNEEKVKGMLGLHQSVLDQLFDETLKEDKELGKDVFQWNNYWLHVTN